MGIPPTNTTWLRNISTAVDIRIPSLLRIASASDAIVTTMSLLVKYSVSRSFS